MRCAMHGIRKTLAQHPLATQDLDCCQEFIEYVQLTK